METALFQNNLIKIGHFILKPDDPNFHQQGYVKKPLIVFPKHSIGIKHHGKNAFIADSSLINLYCKNQYYQRFEVDAKGDYCHWIELSEELLQQVQHLDTLFLTPNVKCDLTTYLLHAQLLDHIGSNQQHNSLKIEELVLEILSNINDQLDIVEEESFTKPIHRKLTERVKVSIHSNLSQNKSLSEIAIEVYSSPYHISRVFKQTTGIGINQFRNQIRLKSVYSKIQQGEEDLATLALNHGFSSHSHLTYSFNKYFGFTPSSISQNFLK